MAVDLLMSVGVGFVGEVGRWRGKSEEVRVTSVETWEQSWSEDVKAKRWKWRGESEEVRVEIRWGRQMRQYRRGDSEEVRVNMWEWGSEYIVLAILSPTNDEQLSLMLVHCFLSHVMSLDTMASLGRGVVSWRKTLHDIRQCSVLQGHRYDYSCESCNWITISERIHLGCSLTQITTALS
jgi:hypothetical protein